MKKVLYISLLCMMTVMVIACDREPADPIDMFTRYEWVADTLYTVDYSKSVIRPELRLDRTNEKFFATAGCNDITGTYRIQGKKIFFNNFSPAVEFCENIFPTEQQLVHMMKSAFTWEIREQKLYFYYKTTLIGVFSKKED